MKKRFALILGLVASTSVLLFWTHQTVIGQNGGSQGGGQADVTNGLLGWWPFDEGHGTNTFEASGTGRTGKLIGNPLPVWTSGISSNALEFDGFQNNVLVPNDAGLTPTDALTLAMWVKVGSNTTSEAIAKWLADGGGGSYVLSLTNGLPELDLSLGGSPVHLAGTTGLIANQWHHIAATYDGTQMQVYVDGMSAGKATATGAIDVVEAPLMIGLVAGKMDDVRIYGRALSSNEIATVYTALAGGLSTGASSNGVFDLDQTNTQSLLSGLPDTQEDLGGTNLSQTDTQSTITSNTPPALQNPGFESGDVPPGHTSTGWVNFGENGPNVYHESLLPRSGLYHLKVFGAFTGPTNESGAYQDLPAQPGQTWRASAYVATPTNDAIRCTSRALVQLEFYDASTNRLSPATSSDDFTVDDLQDTYRLLSATATAPAGTAYARVICLYEQRWQTPGAVFFDDADLSMLTMSLATNCQTRVPDLKSLVFDSPDGLLSQSPAPGTVVNVGTTNISLTTLNTSGNAVTYSLPLTVVRDTAPAVIGPWPVLANPSFETGDGPHSHVIEHWTGFGMPDTNMVNVSQVPYVPHSGAFVAKLFQEWSAATNYTGLYQELPANNGETWYAGVYVWLPADDPIAGANKARVRLEFYDASHILLGQFDSPDLTAYSPQDVWTPLAAWGVAPSRTAYARIVCLFVGDRVSTGSAYFDDASLTKVVVPVGSSCQTAILPDLTSGATATDNCGDAYNIDQTPPAGTSLPVGVTPVTLTAIDDAGNKGHYRVEVAVVDTNVPVFAITSSDTVCPYAPSNTSSVVAVPGASYQWTVKNGSLVAGQGTPTIVWQSGAMGWSVLSVTMTTPAGCAYTNWKSVTVQCTQGWFDSAEDGVTNWQEISTYNANPNAISTDGSGISDYEEIFLALVNPRVMNFNGSVTDAVVKNGADVGNELGSWQIDGTEIFALDRRGYVEYNVTIPSADVYRLALEGREQNNSLTNSSSFDLQVYVDGEYLGRQTLTATPVTYGTIHLYTPYLQPGAHTIRVFWDNAASDTSLRLKDIRLQILGGPSTNGSGIKDWVVSRLHMMCGIDPALPTSSYVSPVSVEGKERFLSMMTITTGATNVPPMHSSGDRWYANVPLTAGTSTTIMVSYQNGGLTQTGMVRWAVKNILDGGTISIRTGDSLLVTAAPVGATNGTVQLTVFSGQQKVAQYSSSASSPVAIPFSDSGTYTILSTFSSNPKTLSGVFTVKVVGQSFATDPAVWVSKTRNWAVTSKEVVLDADPRLMMVPVGASANSTQNFNLMIDQNEPRYVVSRVSLAGPILNAARADGFRLFATPETYIKVLQHYDDGSRLVETMEVLSPVLPDITVQIVILVGGVTFEDGTTYKELTAADFDTLGQYKLRFLMPEGVQTANCHRIQVMQGNDLVGVHH